MHYSQDGQEVEGSIDGVLAQIVCELDGQEWSKQHHEDQLDAEEDEYSCIPGLEFERIKRKES